MARAGDEVDGLLLDATAVLIRLSRRQFPFRIFGAVQSTPSVDSIASAAVTSSGD